MPQEHQEPTVADYHQVPEETIVAEMRNSNKKNSIRNNFLPARITHSSSLLVIVVLGLIFFVGGAGFSFSYFNAQAAHAAQEKSQAAAVATAAAALPDAFASVHLIGQGAYVYDLTTHQVLFTMNADSVRPLASLTKIAMALAVTEVLSPDSDITIPYDTASPGSAEILTQGSVWPMHDVLSFTLIASSNQGADILSAAANDAIHAKYPQSPAGEPNAATLWRMNDIVQSLGLTGMYFDNDNGLDISTTTSGAYGSARDVGTLISYAASTSLQAFAGTTHDTMTFTNAAGQKATAYNTDTALGAIPGIVMGKTGYTDLAGGNLAIIFDTGRFTDM
jgi:D-alanyl-D-alanine carboxypeptidase